MGPWKKGLGNTGLNNLIWHRQIYLNTSDDRFIFINSWFKDMKLPKQIGLKFRYCFNVRNYSMLDPFGSSTTVGGDVWGSDPKSRPVRIIPSQSPPQQDHSKDPWHSSFKVTHVEWSHRGPGAAFSSESECLHQHGEQQGQVLSSSYGKSVCGVEVNQFWYGVKRRAVLSQHVLAIFALSELHVHEPLAAPDGGRTTGRVIVPKKQTNHKTRIKVLQ